MCAYMKRPGRGGVTPPPISIGLKKFFEQFGTKKLKKIAYFWLLLSLQYTFGYFWLLLATFDIHAYMKRPGRGGYPPPNIDRVKKVF